MKPLVSTIIPTYKRADMLPRAMDSVLNQTYSNIEVVVVDDNNPNTTDRKNVEIIMKKYEGNPKVKYVKHDKNKNGSAARNTGIKNAKGEYICFLDDDNYFYKEKIEKQMDYMFKHPQYKAVYCGLRCQDKNIVSNQTGDLTFEQLTGINIIDTNMILMKKSVVEKFGGWDERLNRNQDVAFMLRYFKTGNKIGALGEVLAYYDLSDRSNVANPEKNEKNFDEFLNYYDDQIEDCEIIINNARKKIYCSRYRGVFLSYIKNKDIVGALKLYIKMLKLTPIMFNRYLIIGAFKKLQGKPIQ